MEMTAKAKKEIEGLNEKIAGFRNSEAYFEKRLVDVKNYDERRMYWKEIGKIHTKIDAASDKIVRIQDERISTSERNTLTREAWDKFETLEYERSLGMTSYIKIGYSKVIGEYVSAQLVRYNGFMRNVKGCSSLADKREMISFVVMDKTWYDGIIARNEKRTINMAGEERIVPLR